MFSIAKTKDKDDAEQSSVDLQQDYPSSLFFTNLNDSNQTKSVARSKSQSLKSNLHLNPEVLVPIGPGTTNAWKKKPLVFAEKTRLKYNKATCTAVTMNEASTHTLQKKYHEIHGLPGFAHRFLKGSPSLERALFIMAPEMYKVFDAPESQSKTLLMTNPAYFNFKKFIEDTQQHSKEFAIKQLKNASGGLGLVTWFIHPEALPAAFRGSESSEIVLENRKNLLIKQSKFYCKSIEQEFNFYRYGESMNPLPKVGSFSKLPRNNSQESINTLLEKNKHVYLASLFDLDTNPEWSLKYLRSLRQYILQELEQTYGVTPNDKIKLYLHMPYLKATTTLHVHIRINQADHALENAKSFGINEIIEQLNSGLSVKEMILDRDVIHCSEYPIGEGIDGIKIETVPNPYRDWSDLFGLLSIGLIIKNYLNKAIGCEAVLKRMCLLDFKEIEKLAKALSELKVLPKQTDFIKMIETLSINPELESLGWSLSSGEKETFTDSAGYHQRI